MTMNSDAGLNIEVRDVVRPDSTTKVISIPFHVLKNGKETKNVFEKVNPEDVVLIQRLIDSHTFQPEVAFMIKRKQPDNMSIQAFNQYYIGLMEYFVDAGISEDIICILASRKKKE